MYNVANPIIKGFNPDPSVCKVNGTYYLVTSTFEFFPGITLYKSSNLASWEMIGHCLSDSDSLKLVGCRPSGGLYAPTIRYHDGYFFVTCTNTTDKGNFVIYSQNPEGPWSRPYWIKQGGIDPSLFFDNDGKCYILSSIEHDGTHDIFQGEINPFTGEMLSESVPLMKGFGGKYPESPHMYYLFGKYYVLLAEGGTEYGHMVTMFRSDSIWGPFESCPHNPILSHRGLNAQYSPFQCVGHADFVEDDYGNWWIFALGIRKLPNVLMHNLGRETFLAKMTWGDDGWPTVNNDGILTASCEMDCEPECCDLNFDDDFSSPDFSQEYLFVRNFNKSCYERQNGCLILTSSDSVNSLGAPTLACIRQKEWRANVSAEIKLDNENDFEAGLTAFYCDDQHYDLLACKADGQVCITLKKHLYDIIQTVQIPVSSCDLVLHIDSDEENYYFSVDTGTENIKVGSASVCGLCTEVSSRMTFTGVMFGLLCEKGSAAFRSFSVHY